VPPHTIIGVGPRGEEIERSNACLHAQVYGQVSLLGWLWVGSNAGGLGTHAGAPSKARSSLLG